MITPATTVANLDEPCFTLCELDLQSGHGFHSFQVLYLMRGDKLSEFFYDLGLSSKFKADQFRIPGGVITPNGRYEILHTVGELQEIADEIRNRGPSQDGPHDLQSIWRSQILNKEALWTKQKHY